MKINVFLFCCSQYSFKFFLKKRNYFKNNFFFFFFEFSNFRNSDFRFRIISMAVILCVLLTIGYTEQTIFVLCCVCYLSTESRRQISLPHVSPAPPCTFSTQYFKPYFLHESDRKLMLICVTFFQTRF